MNSSGILSLLSTRHKSIFRHGKRVNAQDASAESTPDLQLEIAYLLLVDVVGYSKLLVNEQVELLQELNRIVRSTECFRAAEASGKLTRVSTGDGMALLFSRSPEEPVRCALKISRALQCHSHIQMRIGVHSGPVNPVKDVSDQTNIAGSGINVRSGCWAAAMLGTFLYRATLRRIYSVPALAGVIGTWNAPLSWIAETVFLIAPMYSATRVAWNSQR